MTYSAYAVTTPGLEEIVSAELSQLGITIQPEKKRPTGEPGEDSGGVAFTASLDQVYQANLHLRCANRIIVRVGEFDAVGFDELRRKAAQIAWETYLKPGVDVAIRTTCRKSRLYHSDAVAREMVKAISQKLGTDSALIKPSEEGDKPAQLIIVRIVNDHCTVSIDSSGELLHRRGYRLETAKAPLRETLAAGLVLLTGWQPEYPLLDPFCGSGTIPIEAAMIARNIAPGRNRRFGFMSWPIFEKKRFAVLLEKARIAETNIPVTIQGSDRDAGAIRIAQANAERAGVADSITWECKAFSAIEVQAERGWLVSNPPYGLRVSPTTDLRNLYTRLGDILRGDLAGWRYGILCSDPILAGHMRVKPSRTVDLVNGGLGVKYYIGG